MNALKILTVMALPSMVMASDGSPSLTDPDELAEYIRRLCLRPCTGLTSITIPDRLIFLNVPDERAEYIRRLSLSSCTELKDQDFSHEHILVPVETQRTQAAPAVGEFRTETLSQTLIDQILAIYQSNQTRDPNLPDPKRAGKEFTDIEMGMAMSIMQIAPKTPDDYKTALRLIFSDERADVLLDRIVSGDFIPA